MRRGHTAATAQPPSAAQQHSAVQPPSGALRFDTHLHFWRYRPADFPWIGPGMAVLAQDRLPEHVSAERAACGIGAGIAVQARCLPEETDDLLALAASRSEVAGVVGWADLQQADAGVLRAQLAQWQAVGAGRFLGLRHILQDEPDVAAWVATPAFRAGLQAVQRVGLVWEVLVFQRQMADTLPVWRTHDAHWLVLDHLAKPDLRRWRSDPAVGRDWAARLRAYAALPHMVCKLSGLITELGVPDPRDGTLLRTCLDVALECFGPQRLMFGSDWPVCLLRGEPNPGDADPVQGTYASVYQLIESWAATRLSVSEQAALWCDNPRRIYGLPVGP